MINKQHYYLQTAHTPAVSQSLSGGWRMNTWSDLAPTGSGQAEPSQVLLMSKNIIMGENTQMIYLNRKYFFFNHLMTRINFQISWFKRFVFNKGCLCLRTLEVLHCWVLWNRHSDWLHTYCHAGESKCLRFYSPAGRVLIICCCGSGHMLVWFRTGSNHTLLRSWSYAGQNLELNTCCWGSGQILKR